MSSGRLTVGTATAAGADGGRPARPSRRLARKLAAAPPEPVATTAAAPAQDVVAQALGEVAMILNNIEVRGWRPPGGGRGRPLRACRQTAAEDPEVRAVRQVQEVTTAASGARAIAVPTHLAERDRSPCLRYRHSRLSPLPRVRPFRLQPHPHHPRHSRRLRPRRFRLRRFRPQRRRTLPAVFRRIPR